MLKAYSYIESEYLDPGIVDRSVFSIERKIIAEFTANNPTPEVLSNCVFCGGFANVFISKESVSYQRCSQCFSIFANVDDEIINRYKIYAPLMQFRNSPEFQNSAVKRRQDIWNDLLFWLEFRFARYLHGEPALKIINIGNRFNHLAEMIKNSSFCGSYNDSEPADVVLYFDQFRCLANPIRALTEIRGLLRDSGLLVMNMTVGSGFDILALRDKSENFLPYEVVLLPSTEGVEHLLNKAGFDVLEMSTPGALDVQHVELSKDALGASDLFVQYLINKTDRSTHAEFQRFLQKSGMSSHARVIAKKRYGFDETD